MAQFQIWFSHVGLLGWTAEQQHITLRPPRSVLNAFQAPFINMRLGTSDCFTKTFKIVPHQEPKLMFTITLSGPKVEVQRSQEQEEEEDDYSLWCDGDFLKSSSPAVLLRLMAP